MWFMRSGMTENTPDEEVKLKAQAIALKYFTENPYEIRVPRELYEPLFFARFGVKSGSANANGISKDISR